MAEICSNCKSLNEELGNMTEIRTQNKERIKNYEELIENQKTQIAKITQKEFKKASASPQWQEFMKKEKIQKLQKEIEDGKDGTKFNLKIIDQLDERIRAKDEIIIIANSKIADFEGIICDLKEKEKADNENYTELESKMGILKRQTEEGKTVGIKANEETMGKLKKLEAEHEQIKIQNGQKITNMKVKKKELKLSNLQLSEAKQEYEKKGVDTDQLKKQFEKDFSNEAAKNERKIKETEKKCKEFDEENKRLKENLEKTAEKSKNEEENRYLEMKTQYVNTQREFDLVNKKLGKAEEDLQKMANEQIVKRTNSVDQSKKEIINLQRKVERCQVTIKANQMVMLVMFVVIGVLIGYLILKID